jgi:hypothetical protein
MSTLKIASRYLESPMLIVPSAAGFPVVFGSATRSGRGRLPTALGLALAVAVLCVTTAPCAPASAAAAAGQMSAAPAAAGNRTYTGTDYSQSGPNHTGPLFRGYPLSDWYI